jgi:hypothetical protein
VALCRSCDVEIRVDTRKRLIRCDVEIRVRFRFCRSRVYDVDARVRSCDGDVVDDGSWAGDVAVTIFSSNDGITNVGVRSFEGGTWVHAGRGGETKERGNWWKRGMREGGSRRSNR